MAIIDKTYFDGGELNIPGTERVAVSEVIDEFISIYEPEYLVGALGYPLKKLLDQAGTPAAGTRFYELLNGAEYVDGQGYTKKWIGLKPKLTSPIAKYVWYWFQRKNASYSTTMGEQKGKTENADNVGVDVKQMQHWNSMKRTTDDLWDYLYYAKNGDGSKRFSEFDTYQTRDFGVVNIGNL